MATPPHHLSRPGRRFAGRLATPLLCAAALLATACDADQPTAPADPPPAAELRGVAFRITVDAVTGQVGLASAGPAAGGSAGLSFSLLGRSEIEVATSNFTRSAVGAYEKKKVRIQFDVALTNQLQGANLVTPTFPQPPLGQKSLMLFPFVIDRIVGKGEVAPSTDWDGDGTPGGGAPYNFFNDAQCKNKISTCYRWKGFPSPLAAGATSPAQTIGFDVDADVQSFEVYLVLAADLQNPGAISGTVTSPEKGALADVVVTLEPGGRTATTDALGRYTFAALVPGAVTVTLGNLPARCSAVGAKSVTVVAGATATANFDVACQSERIAYVFKVANSDKAQIYLMNTDGTGRVHLGDDAAEEGGPAWSPDGRQIAFSSFRGGLWQIYKMNSDGSGLVGLSGNTGWDTEPAWSPDGRQIAFIAAAPSGDEARLYVMNADGTGRTLLYDDGTTQYQPSWSPDGRKILFRMVSQIYAINTDGSGLIRLSDGTHDDSDPSWSPDGRKIAFTSRTLSGGHPQLYTMNADGTGRTRLIDSPDWISSPSWSPEGRWIIFVSSPGSGPNGQLNIIGADGTRRTQLTASGHHFTPRWQP